LCQLAALCAKFSCSVEALLKCNPGIDFKAMTLPTITIAIPCK
jgi:hypothetical protein